jgi:hypothetical protein
MRHFSELSDPRREQGKRHLLSNILALTICAVLSGANTLALLLLKRQASVKASLQTKRLRGGWNNDYLLKILNA